VRGSDVEARRWREEWAFEQGRQSADLILPGLGPS
jgi:hypothetical protein